MSELVKIDPQSLGVGLYQHDMGRKELKEALEGVVESCVNQVGVDINTASVPLLRYVSGLNQMVAREIVEYRKNQGPFTSREQLLSSERHGPGALHAGGGVPQDSDRRRIRSTAPGFIRKVIRVAEKVLAELGFTPSVLDDKAAHPDISRQAERSQSRRAGAEAGGRRADAGRYFPRAGQAGPGPA